jgi:cell wall-associated NlpC family hydrolase
VPKSPLYPVRIILVACTALASGVAAPTWAQASPEPPAVGAELSGDSLMRLIAEKGWAPVEAVAPSVRQVRHAASELVVTAFNFLGLQYRSGGSNVDEGFDCSGFVRYLVHNTMGLVLPRSADEQAKASAVVPIGRDELQPGDLVFFNTLRRSFSHVGIYIGDGKFIHSPRTGSSVRVEDMRMSYWTTRFNGARRIQEPTDNLSRPAVR